MTFFFKNFLHLFIAGLACIYYRFPARQILVIGVTGTSGKTTTAHLIYEILKNAGKKVSLVSTIEAVINNTSYDTGFHVTTPSPWALQKFIRKAVDGKSKYFVLEVTSHALSQARVFGTSIDIGVVTNISHEHLDYHKTRENYRMAKAKILRGVKYSVINRDDSSFPFLVKKADGKVVTFATDSEADYTQEKLNLKPSIPGKFNLQNCLAAAAVASILKIDKDTIAKSITKFKGIAGRMEKIDAKRPFDIYIDFAHKPDALKQALLTARDETENKLIVIFGCAGLRDRLKRPMMGEIAAKLADFTILTAEDPRTEDVRDIIGQIADGSLTAGAEEENKKDK
ncbi:UDP-N-acetylmuramoyl-L-alanyl-D-glutamate--2,6-diaminopimelate ligase, partial [Candidatus Gottesmanbacteria bacterium]|nr:UDP-N-acetylmuramoyl-L-alanyl-D-glutamate--2,6-diaminopimelate ligase [Candidatus Gottesmanbacteria bacterium]